MNPKVSRSLRILLGIFLSIFGLNYLLQLIPLNPIDGDGGILMEIYIKSGFMTFISVLELLCGLALLTGKFIPTATIIAGAILFNAFLFHVLHDISGIAGSAVGLPLCILVYFGYREKFGNLFSL